MKSNRILMGMFCSAVLLLGACADDPSAPSGEFRDADGNLLTLSGSDFSIQNPQDTAQTFSITSTAEIADASWRYTLQDADGHFHFLVVTDAQQELFYCQSDAHAESLEEIENVASCEADRQMTWNNAPPIEGSYTDEWSTEHTIGTERWTNQWGTEMTWQQWDAIAQEGIAQFAEDDAYNPSLFTRIEWDWDADGGLYYCQSVFDGTSIEDAQTRDGRADRSDFRSLGTCGTFNWTRLK